MLLCFRHLTRNITKNTIKASPATLPTTLPTTTGVDGADSESELESFAAAAVLEEGPLGAAPAGPPTYPPGAVGVGFTYDESREEEVEEDEINVVSEEVRLDERRYASDVEEMVEFEKAAVVLVIPEIKGAISCGQ